MAIRKYLIINFLLLSLIFSTVSLAGSMKPFKKYIVSPNERSLEYILSMKPTYIVKVIKALKDSKAINKSEKKIKNTQLLMEKLEEKIDDDDVLDAIEKLNAKISASLDKIKKEKKSYSIFLLGGFKSWQDSFTINYPTNAEENKSMNRGPCAGAGIEYGNAIWRLSAEGCAGFMATFSNTSYETGLSMWYVSAELGGRYFLSDHSAVGFGVPIIFRNADYLIPGDDQGYANASSVDGVSYFNFGANIKYYYDISKRFQFSMGFGGILGSGALSWSNGVRFYF